MKKIKNHYTLIIYKEDDFLFSKGEKNWRRNGLLHKDNGPAIIYPSGSQSWYLNGVLINHKSQWCINK